MSSRMSHVHYCSPATPGLLEPRQCHLFIQQPHEANVGASSTVKEKGLLQEALLSANADPSGGASRTSALFVGDDHPTVVLLCGYFSVKGEFFVNDSY